MNHYEKICTGSWRKVHANDCYLLVRIFNWTFLSLWSLDLVHCFYNCWTSPIVFMIVGLCPLSLWLMDFVCITTTFLEGFPSLVLRNNLSFQQLPVVEFEPGMRFVGRHCNYCAMGAWEHHPRSYFLIILFNATRTLYFPFS